MKVKIQNQKKEAQDQTGIINPENFQHPADINTKIRAGKKKLCPELEFYVFFALQYI